MNRWSWKKGLSTGVITLASTAVYANGFYIPQQNITNLVTSYAGIASLAEDASINFHNSAGLTRLPNRQTVFGVAFADSNTLLQVDSARNPAGGAITPDSTKPDSFAIIPSFHYANPIDEKWSWGISAVSTFGSKTNYGESSVARFLGTKSEMITIDIAPSVAYKVNPNLSVGGGLDIFYVHAKLHKQIIAPGPFEGYYEDHGRDIAMGMHIGFLYEWNDDSRLGLSYRSRVNAKLKGTSSQNVAPNVVNKVDVKADINFPDMAILSGYHKVNDRWAVMADAQWFNWSRLKQIVLRYATGATATLPYNYKDSYRFALGGSYQYNDKLKIKFGTSYDTTPTNDTYRTIAVPDQDQTALGLGFQYQYSKDFTFDVAYAHIFTKNAKINQKAATVTGLPQTVESITGHTKQHINVLGFQVIWNIF